MTESIDFRFHPQSGLEVQNWELQMAGGGQWRGQKDKGNARVGATLAFNVYVIGAGGADEFLGYLSNPCRPCRPCHRRREARPGPASLSRGSR
jgi:hypothetical protein